VTSSYDSKVWCEESLSASDAAVEPADVCETSSTELLADIDELLADVDESLGGVDETFADIDETLAVADELFRGSDSVVELGTPKFLPVTLKDFLPLAKH